MQTHYYSFPDEIKSPELHRKWVQGLNSCSPAEIVPVQDSRVCSEHFSTEMFDNKYGLLGEKAVLKSNAVPRIFENPELHSEQATPTIFEVHSQVSIFHPKTTGIPT